MFENVRFSPAFLIRPSGAPSPRGKGHQLVLPFVWGAVEIRNPKSEILIPNSYLLPTSNHLLFSPIFKKPILS